MKEVFEFPDYKAYCNDRLDQPELGFGRGARRKLAGALSCQTSFIAQVLKGNLHFNLDQAEKINQFFSHTNNESEYFLGLVQLARATSKALQLRLTNRLRHIFDENQNLSKRLQVKQELTKENQQKYYSHWLYSAAHIATSISKVNSVDSLKSHLQSNHQFTSQVVQFLLDAGLIQNSDHGLQMKKARLHLPHDSNYIHQHHTNWRLKAIEEASKNNDYSNLHYSSVVSVSKKDFAAIKEELIKKIAGLKKTIAQSESEELVCLTIDCFRLF